MPSSFLTARKEVKNGADYSLALIQEYSIILLLTSGQGGRYVSRATIKSGVSLIIDSITFRFSNDSLLSVIKSVCSETLHDFRF